MITMKPQRRLRSKGIIMNYILLTIGIIALFVFIMFLLTVILYRSVTYSGKNNVGEVGSDYSEEMFGNDEIGDLVKSFNSMENALKEQMDNIASMTAEKEKARAELGVATRIQEDMIPVNFSVITDRGMCDIYGSMTPAKEVGGDFYDFFVLSDDRLCAVIADVSGKGVPAALFMTKSKTYIKQRALAGGSPGEILADVNNELCADNGEMLFITVWLGIINTKTGDVAYCNAGHEYPVVLHNGKCTVFKEDKNDPPLALSENYSYTEKTMKLEKGDGLFIYTDGIPEAKNDEDKRYGMDRMIEKLEGCEADMSCEDVIHTMGSDMASFVNNKDPFDDVTMLMIRLNM